MSHNPALPFYESFRRFPNALALVIDGKNYSYAELWSAASRVAGAIATSSSPRKRVAIVCARSVEAYAGILGASLAGASFIPVNPRWSPERLSSILEQTEPDRIVVDPTEQVRLKSWLDRLPQEKILLPTKALDPGPTHPVEMSESETAYFIFTSGSTGKPKGVAVSAGALRAFVDAMHALHPLGPDERFSQHSDLNFDLSLMDLFVAWKSGGSLWVIPEAQRIFPGEFIRTNELTVWVSVPSAISFMDRIGQLAVNRLPSLRWAFFCGEPLTRNRVKQWRRAAPSCIVENHYGPIEATVACLFHRVTEQDLEEGAPDILPIGKPYPGMQAAIVEGELLLSGRQLAQGYFLDEKLTRERFVERAGARWYRTGDAAVSDERGGFHFKGRLDRQIKVRGFRVELDSLEQFLQRQFQAEGVAAIGWPVRDGLIEGLAAFIAGSPFADEENWAERVKELPENLRPARLKFIDVLPVNERGKIDREALANLLKIEE